VLYPKMLAAGVQFFDRPMREEEVRFSTPIREGRVDFGPLIIHESIEPAKDGDKKRADGRLR
jgi:hypothetical protein